MQITSGRNAAGRGFTLVELLMTIAIIAIIAAFVVPSLISSKKGANEMSAIASLRTIQSAMVAYAKRFHAAATLEELASRNMIDEQLGSGAKSGYTFEVVVAEEKKDSGIIASPSSWGTTGERRFKINWIGQITFTTAEDDASVSQANPLGGK